MGIFGSASCTSGNYDDCRSGEGGRVKTGKWTQIYGSSSQVEIGGPFAGSQCTTLAMSAAIFWDDFIGKGKVDFTPQMINRIMTSGNRLHSYLRLNKELSGEHDGRIAIDDLLEADVSGVPLFDKLWDIKVTNSEWRMSSTKNKDGLMPFKSMLKSCRKPGAKLITVGVLSHSVFINKDKSVCFFDSHGLAGRLFATRVVDKASVFKFPTIGKFIKFLVRLHGKNNPVQIADVIVTRSITDEKTGDTCTGYKPNLPMETLPKHVIHVKPAFTDDIADDDDSGPYSAFMAGGRVD